MIRKVRGNLLDADAQALVNTVNTVGIMGRGIALQFKRAFPANFELYSKACRDHSFDTGMVLTCDLHQLHNPRFIINFPTKRHWKGNSKIEFIEAGLVALVGEVRRLGLTSIAIPPLGCGLGGLSWPVVYRLIENASIELEGVDAIVYEPAGAPEASSMTNRAARPKMTTGRASLLCLMKRYLSPLMDDSVSLLEIHKLMYFMQEAGEGLKLEYVKGRYGPYATNLHNVLEHIEGHFVVGYGDGEEKPGKPIEVDEESALEAENFVADRKETLGRFRKLARLIESFETPFGMELLASVHWIATREIKTAPKSYADVVEGVQAWNDRKRRIFKPDHIQVAWDRLHAERWM